MPFIEGGELYKILKKQKRFKEILVKFYIAQIILALGYVHDKGYIHRDLKLENMLLQSDGYLKLIDFGLAKKLDRNDVADTVCGTCEYMAPEILKEEGYTKNVDWWAVGILIYEMLIGKTPFVDKTAQKVE